MSVPIVLALVLLARGADAAALLSVDATPTVAADGTSLRLVVTNGGDAGARDVRPSVHHQNVTHDGAPLAALPAGVTHEWIFALARPVEPGAVPAIVDVRWTDEAGAAHAIPHVVAIETSGLPAPDVTLDFESTRITRYGRATLTLENHGDVPIHGRVVVALPGGVVTEPVSQAADVAPGRRVAFPMVLQPQGTVSTGLTPAFAFFDYGLDGRRHVVVRRTMLDVAMPSGAVSPLVVGGTALGLAFAALAAAWRIAARRRAAARP